MLERYLLGLTAVPFVVGALMPGTTPAGDEVTRFEDPQITESSGLAVLEGMFVTTNDSGDTGRLFTVDPVTGRTLAVTQWSSPSTQPEDVEALAPASGDADVDEVWVGDIGDNQARRASVRVARVYVGPGSDHVDALSYELVYPEGPRDAESLIAHPATGRLYVISKGVLGGSVYAAPKRLSAGRPNRLEEIGPVLGIATDAAFFPDGRHIVVRSYSEAAVYSWPDLTEVGSFGLPDQQQGEGIAVAPDGTIYASSEGLHAPVLRIALPAVVKRAMDPAPSATPTITATPTPSPTPPPGTRQGRELPEQPPADRSAWSWALGGILGLGIVVVLVRALRPH